MQDRLLKELKELITELDLQPGQRLPSERSLSNLLGVSRNSLRRLIHMLEARGIVEIKKGSGSYLKTKALDLYDIFSENNSNDPVKSVKEQLEAAYIFLPIIVEQAALNINEELLKNLQKCNIELSKSILSKEPENTWNESITFFKLIAQGTKNYFIVKVLEQICFTELMTVKFLSEINNKERERLFADHVNILNALREQSKTQAKKITREYILRLGKMVDKRKGGLND